ncbi:MAG: hypothetical protein KAV87_14715 [Desulfobacteraceae bacterium]|nr:hypothetical protein [Desulfobacteraceae bacterium]
MALEVRARDIIITDARDYFVLRRYLNQEESRISRPVKALWKKQAELVTVETTKIALESRNIPDEWKTPWERMIREFVRDDVLTEWIKNIAVAGDGIAKKVNRLQRKQFDFDSTMTSVKAWVDTEGGSLIVDLTAAQMSSTHALLQHQIALEVTSPYVLSQRIKPLVGLTNRETMAVAKFMATLQEQGVSPAMINKQVANYAKFLHKNRASRIARTEISNAYNFGQMNSLGQAVSEGWLPGVPEKSWIAGGADPCEICLENEAAGPIALDAAFPSGDEHPTAHPNCLTTKTPVFVPGATKGFKTSYYGPLIRIVFVGGDVTVTPNHLFLTPEGFARASSLRKGDKILYSLQFEREMFGHPDNNGKPPMIEQVVASLTKTSGMTTVSMPMTTEYFHGDGAFMDGDVSIIASDGFLKSDSKSKISEFFSKNSLTSFNSNLPLFSGNGNLASMLLRLRDATNGGVGSRCESLAFRRRSNIFPHKFSNFAHGSNPNSSLNKTSSYNSSIDIKALRNFLFRFSSEISLRDVLDIQIIFSHRALPVYDIETSSSLYIANGLVSSNCECAVGYRVRR